MRYALIIAFTSAGFWLGSPPATRAQSGPINIKVDVQSDKEYETTKSTQKRTTIEKKRLKITLKNFSPKAYPSATVDWYIFAEDYNAGKLTVAEKGDEIVELPKGGGAEIESTQAQLEYTGAYTKKSGGKTERVDKIGLRYRGWGVQVRDGGKVISERFDPADLKQVLNPKPADAE